MSKFKDEIAEKLFQHLDKNLSVELKAQLTPTIVSELIYHSADFITIEKLNAIFDQAIELQKALTNSQVEVDTDEDEECFMSDLKKL